MNKFLGMLALSALVGCGYSESKFTDELAEATCTYLADCTDLYDDVDTCLNDAEPGEVDETCEYDSGKAKECVDAVKALTCENDMSDFPTVCGDVYTCADDTGDTDM